MRFKDFYTKNTLLTEGGGYGHLSHFYDVKSNTFSDLKDFISKALSGELERMRLKTDGMNLMLSVIDGDIRAARNKTHLKNFGQKSLTLSEMAEKYSGIEGIQRAYTETMKDFKSAVKKLSNKEIDKYFENGKKWASVEVMTPLNANIIKYDVTELRVHDIIEYDIDGNRINTYKQEAESLAKKLEKMGRQNTFLIRPLEVAELKPLPDLDKQKEYFINKVNKLQNKYNIKDSDTIQNYIQKRFISILEKHVYSKPLIKTIANKIIGIEKTNINKIIKQITDDNVKIWLKDYMKNEAKNDMKKILQPIELIILELGAKIMKNITRFMTLHPDKAVQKLKTDINKTIDKIQKTKNPELIKKLNSEIERLNNIGGTDMIAPEEGITFIYKDNFYKLTGAFAPVNQILGLRFKLE